MNVLPQVESWTGVGITDFQIYRAAGFTSNFLDYKYLIDTEKLPCEKTRAGAAVCMDQFTRMFGVTRVPFPDCDRNFGVHPAPAKHICVIVRDQIFVVHVYGKNGCRLRVDEIERFFVVYF